MIGFTLEMVGMGIVGKSECHVVDVNTRVSKAAPRLESRGYRCHQNGCQLWIRHRGRHANEQVVQVLRFLITSGSEGSSRILSLGSPTSLIEEKVHRSSFGNHRLNCVGSADRILSKVMAAIIFFNRRSKVTRTRSCRSDDLNSSRWSLRTPEAECRTGTGEG